MTEKLNFKWKWDRLVEILRSQETKRMDDVGIMMELGFSPPSWKVWKPKFIELAHNRVITTHDSKTGKIKEYAVSYDKKRKLWGWSYLSEYDEPKS